MTPIYICILIPGTCKYSLIWQKELCRCLTKLKILQWGDFLGSSMWVTCNHKGFIRKKQEVREERRYYTAGNESGRPGCAPKETDPHLEPPEETSSANTLVFIL